MQRLLSVDWEEISYEKQGDGLVNLLRDVRLYLPANQYEVTTALPAGEWTLRHIDVAELAKYATINLMAYDFFGDWSLSGYHAQLQANSPDGTSGRTAVQYLLDSGVPPSRILFGVPLYGRSFKGTHTIGQNHHRPGQTFKYNELPLPGTAELVDHKAVAACCIDNNEGLVTYDNDITITLKADYVKEQKLGGLFYWEATQDKTPDAKSLIAVGRKRLNMMETY